MMYSVCAADRSSAGLPGINRGGRFWPGGEEKIVEVIDSDACPMIDNPIHPGRQMIDPVRIGRRNWALIVAEKTLAIREAPEGSRLSIPQASAHEQLRDENNELRRQLFDLSKRMAAIEAGNAQADDLKAQAEASDARALLAEQTAGRLTLERDELLRHVEQLTAPPPAPPVVIATTDAPASFETQTAPPVVPSSSDDTAPAVTILPGKRRGKGG
jgi:hypothetical protein